MSLIRIVRMTFDEQKVPVFKKVFEENMEKIRSFPGCLHLELHRDVDNPAVWATYSIWTGKEALENYRQSELFSQVWKHTKALFADKPRAFSHEVEMVVENRP
jgi:quinol monooxygenase YgiN